MIYRDDYILSLWEPFSAGEDWKWRGKISSLFCLLLITIATALHLVFKKDLHMDMFVENRFLYCPENLFPTANKNNTDFLKGFLNQPVCVP